MVGGFLSVQSGNGHLTGLLPEMTCTELADNYPHILVTTASTATASVQSADSHLLPFSLHSTTPPHCLIPASRYGYGRVPGLCRVSCKKRNSPSYAPVPPFG